MTVPPASACGMRKPEISVVPVAGGETLRLNVTV
jgi:hypothetical protein